VVPEARVSGKSIFCSARRRWASVEREAAARLALGRARVGRAGEETSG